MSVKISLIIFLVSVMSYGSGSFLCGPGGDPKDITFGNAVCKNPLVLRAKILNITDQEGNQVSHGIPQRIYKISVVSVFRNQKNANPVPTEIYTNTPRALDGCTAHFDIGKEYLILAHQEESAQRYITDCCKKNTLWSDVPSDVVQGLENGTLGRSCT